MDLSRAQHRYLLLLEQLLEEEGGRDKHGARRAAGERVGISQSHVTQLLDGVKKPGQTIIDRAIKKLGLDGRFFSDETPARPRYRDYVAGQEPTLHRDDEIGSDAIERYIAGEAATARPVDTHHQAELRSLRRSLGPDSITEEVVRGLHRGLVARDANRALDQPLVEARVESEHGQKTLPPARRRKKPN